LWMARKMASLGFADATAKPTVSWTVHIDPGLEGRYQVKMTLRAGGATRFEQTYELPAVAAEDRANKAFATSFAAPPK